MAEPEPTTSGIRPKSQTAVAEEGETKVEVFISGMTSESETKDSTKLLSV